MGGDYHLYSPSHLPALFALYNYRQIHTRSKVHKYKNAAPSCKGFILNFTAPHSTFYSTQDCTCTISKCTQCAKVCYSALCYNAPPSLPTIIILQWYSAVHYTAVYHSSLCCLALWYTMLRCITAHCFLLQCSLLWCSALLQLVAIITLQWYT